MNETKSIQAARPKALYAGTLFDGLLDCYVLDDDRRVVSQRGVIRALSGAAGTATLERFLDRIPGGSAMLTALPELGFSMPGGGIASGIAAESIPDILQLYVDALGTGTLHPKQLPIAVRAARLLGAFAKVGIIALIDEATGFQEKREAAALSFTFRAILLEGATRWDLMWPLEFVEAICKLHGIAFNGVQPRFLASTYDKLYHLILGDEVCAELKRRNPEPKFGTNHHQWLTPEAREVVRRQIPLLVLLAEQVGSKDEFWARVEHKYGRSLLQLSWLAPSRVRDSEAVIQPDVLPT